MVWTIFMALSYPDDPLIAAQQWRYPSTGERRYPDYPGGRCALVHRLGKTANGFFPAAARRTVREDCDLLDVVLPDSFDLLATFIYGSGDGKFIDKPIRNHLGMVRLL